MPHFAVDRHSPAALLDDAIDCRQSQSGAFAGCLGGEKRLEHVGLCVGIHSMAGIADGEHRVLAGGHAEPLPGGFVDVHVRRLDGQNSTARHGVTGVDGEVDQHLLQLSAIRFDFPEIIGQSQGNLDIFAHQPAEHFGGAADYIIKFEYGSLPHRLPAEGQQTIGELGGAASGAENLIDAAA